MTDPTLEFKHSAWLPSSRRTAGHLRSLVCGALRAAQVTLLKIGYILERGYDSELPPNYGKSIVAVAGCQPAPTP